MERLKRVKRVEKVKRVERQERLATTNRGAPNLLSRERRSGSDCRQPARHLCILPRNLALLPASVDRARRTPRKGVDCHIWKVQGHGTGQASTASEQRPSEQPLSGGGDVKGRPPAMERVESGVGSGARVEGLRRRLVSRAGGSPGSPMSDVRLGSAPRVAIVESLATRIALAWSISLARRAVCVLPPHPPCPWCVPLAALRELAVLRELPLAGRILPG